MLRDKTVSRRACLVYASLSSRSGLGAIFPSQSTIAEEAGVSERTARSALQELEMLGVVERIARRGKEGRATSRTNAYVLHPNGRYEEPADVAVRSKGPAKGPATSDEGTGNSEHLSLYKAEIEEAERGTSDVASDALPPKYKPEVYHLCNVLVEHVRANGHKVGVVGETWWSACDRLMRLDGYSAEQIDWMIRWATTDEFWQANIRSMPKLREKFSTLVLQAKREAKPKQVAPADRFASTVDMGRRLAEAVAS